MVLSEAILIMAYTFSEFASIPLWDTMNPKNFPEVTPKTHVAGFSFIWYFLRVLNVSLRSSRWVSCSLLLMCISSTYYNQIKMAKEDQEKTTFIISQGLYCYKVMPFGIKNAGATYQRLVNKMFSK